MQILIQTLQDVWKHPNRSFRHCCPHFHACHAYSFLFWSMSSIYLFFFYFFILIYWENHYLFLDWRSSSLCSQDRSQVNLGTAEPAIVRPCISVLLQTLLQQDSCFSWLAGPAWKKLAFQDLHSACFHAYEGFSHLYTVLTWPCAEQEFFEPSFVQKEMSRI